MQITFYKNQSENRMINKTLTDALVLDGQLRETGISLTNPSISFELDESIFTYNYAYIPLFNRYYYITKIEVQYENLITIYFHCDVLASFKDEILANSGYVDNSKNYANFYLNDKNLPVQQNTQITVFRPIPSGFEGASIVMTAFNTSYITDPNTP